MDESTRAAFLVRIKRDVSALTGSDRDFLKHAMTVIMQLIADPRMGPLTWLTATEEAFARIDLRPDEEIAAELHDPVLGLMLDQVILGKLPAAAAVRDRSAPTEFVTLGGASATLINENEQLVLTDTWNRKVRVSDPVLDGPKVTWRESDDFLMWDEWNWLERS